MKNIHKTMKYIQYIIYIYIYILFTLPLPYKHYPSKMPNSLSYPTPTLLHPQTTAQLTFQVRIINNININFTGTS